MAEKRDGLLRNIRLEIPNRIKRFKDSLPHKYFRVSLSKLLDSRHKIHYNEQKLQKNESCMSIEDFLYNKVSLRILAFLSRHPNKQFYQREIAGRTGTSIGATNQSLNRLFKLGLISCEKRGKMYFYSSNIDSVAIKYFKIFTNLVKLQTLVDSLSSISNQIILFGSCAKGGDTDESDIDLFIHSEYPDKVREVLKFFKLDRAIKPVIVNSLDFVSLKRKDKEFYKQIKDGIVLWRKKASEL